MNRYDDRARLVFHFAREEGNRLGHAMVGPEHLLLGLIREAGSTARILGEFGLTLENARRSVENIIGRGEGDRSNDAPAITPRARWVMELASAEAKSLGAQATSTEHILLGLIREGDGVAYRILEEFTKDVDTLRWRVLADAESAPERPGDTALTDTSPAAREAAFEVKAHLVASLEEPPPDPALLVARALSVGGDVELRFLLAEAVSRWLNGNLLNSEQTRAIVGLLVNASK